MKTVKTIVVIVTILLVGFLSIGLLVKTTVYKTEVLIDKPIEKVFTVFNDGTKTENWIPEFKSIKAIEEKEGKVGSTYQISLEKNGNEVTMKEKVLAFIPNKKVTLNYSVEGMLKKNDFSFTTEGDETKIIQESTCKSDGYLMRCMLPFFKSKLKNQDQAYLDNFKNYIEKN